MKTIDLERWEPKDGSPNELEHAGSRTGKEVFEELKYRLESFGLLPDEYFLLAPEWEEGKEIPKDADIFCTTDYGESEGVYIDGYLHWYDGEKPVNKKFFTGKTLGSSGSDLDRMFLISSAITKAFHGYRGQYARYILVGVPEESGDMILHLKPEEQRTFIDALALQREQLLGNVNQTEQLLRRLTGGVLQFMDEVGHSPLRLDSFDKAQIAIRDGNLDAFKENLPAVREHLSNLLPLAAERPGVVGRKMCVLLLSEATEIPGELYLKACKKAVVTGDRERVNFLMEQAEQYVKDSPLAVQGAVIDYAYGEQRQMGRELIQHSAPERIAAAPSFLLYRAALCGDYSSATTLVKKGLDASDRAADVLHVLCASSNEWIAEHLIQNGMKFDPNDIFALHACVKNGALKAATALLDRGMDFDRYQTWLETSHRSTDGHDDIVQELEEHWLELHPQEQAAATVPEVAPPRMDAPTMG